VLVSSSTAALLDTNNSLLQDRLLRDLGEHRLKDLSAPERIFQLGDSEFPALKSLYRTNLPVPATPFLGRERELGEVCELLARDDVRLLTLTGAGGTGKTRLALQAAAAASDAYPDGVFWVPLAAVRDPQLVLQEAAQAVGADDGLADHIADKQLLLLLDNFEHLTDAATDTAALLTACPNLTVLVTSRELLRLPGEQAYPVPPLQPEDGSELFLARARVSEPGFAPSAAVGELCARLEQLPLALELAAARVRVLTPEQLLERLGQRLDLLKAGRGVDARQQTLRATIEWSYDLLTNDEQQLFAGLSVFAGGCTLEAAEDVLDADLDTIQSLVDKSLLRLRDHDRFWMLETIREFAGERLDASGDADTLHRRHAEYYLALAEEAGPRIERGDVGPWLPRVEAEHDNLRLTLEWLESADGPVALRLAGAMWPFWDSGHVAEGRRRLERVLSTVDAGGQERAKALLGLAYLARQDGDSAAGASCAHDAMTHYRALSDDRGVAESELVLGLALADEREFSRARDLIEHAIPLFREAGDDVNELFAARMLAWMYEELGEYARMRVLLEDALERARLLGDTFNEAGMLSSLATLERLEGRPDRAVSLMRDVLRIRRNEGSPYQTALDLNRFARALAETGEVAALAATVIGCVDALLDEVGTAGPPYVQETTEVALTAIGAHLDPATLEEARECGRKLTAVEAIALALGEADA
jgi:predicted ATPase